MHCVRVFALTGIPVLCWVWRRAKARCCISTRALFVGAPSTSLREGMDSLHSAGSCDNDARAAIDLFGNKRLALLSTPFQSQTSTRCLETSILVASIFNSHRLWASYNPNTDNVSVAINETDSEHTERLNNRWLQMWIKMLQHAQRSGASEHT